MQVGITLVSVFTGVFGGARIASHLEQWLDRFPDVAAVAGPLALGVVVVVMTFLTLVFGGFVPKQLALRRPEHIAARLARPLSMLAALVAPTSLVARRQHHDRDAPVRSASRRRRGSDARRS